MKSRHSAVALAAASTVLLLAGCAATGDAPEGDVVTLKLESWRAEDATVWEKTIIPAFEKAHPEINIEYTPTKATEYDAALASRFEGGTAGDLIMCRPGAINRVSIEKGYLEPLTGFEVLDVFDETALSSWNSAEGEPYCVPTASVSAGFFYNKAIFEELGLEVPATEAEFMDVLQAIQDDGTYTPLSFGVTPADSWAAEFMGLYNIGPNYWKGEEGHQGLIDGTKKFSDPEFVEALTVLESWTPYLPEGATAVTYADSIQLFALGQAAIFPSGSWDINGVTANGLDVGVFAPPLPEAGADLYMQSQPDQGVGINAASEHKEEAKVFLEWAASAEFSQLYGDALPGFFGMSGAEVSLDNALSNEFATLLASAQLTPRLGQDQLSGGTPDFSSNMRNLVQQMMSGALTPQEVAEQGQAQLESWYAPQQ